MMLSVAFRGMLNEYMFGWAIVQRIRVTAALAPQQVWEPGSHGSPITKPQLGQICSQNHDISISESGMDSILPTHMGKWLDSTIPESFEVELLRNQFQNCLLLPLFYGCPKHVAFLWLGKVPFFQAPFDWLQINEMQSQYFIFILFLYFKNDHLYSLVSLNYYWIFNIFFKEIEFIYFIL